MNKLIDTLLHIAGCTLILLLLSGCVNERIADCPQGEDGQSHLYLRLAVEDMPAMRATTTEPGEAALNENKIETIQILFYRSGEFYWSVAPAVTADGNYSIPIPEDKQEGFQGTNEYNIYVVTNMGHFTAPQQEAGLDKLLVTESINKPTNDKFVMQGKVSKQIDLATTEGKQLGEVGLRRVASKLRITPQVGISGYTQHGSISVRFVGAVDRGYLLSPDQATEALPVTYADRSVPQSGSSAQPFYSYAIDWSQHTERAPYYLVTVPLQKEGSTETQSYYYRVPLQPQESRLQANKLYDLKATISQIGSSIPEDPVEVTGELTVINWSTSDDAYDLPASNYLEVAEQTAYMYNTINYSIPYQSSKEPVSVRIVEVSYSYVNAQGESVTEAISSDDVAQYPRVTAQRGALQIYSTVPVNNIPKKIRFVVSNGIQGLDKEVTVYQYPSQFITNTTGMRSSRRPNGKLEKHLKNKAIYRITVLTPPDDGTILGFPPMEWTNFYKRRKDSNPEHSTWTTQRDAETARMVSPSFELASQLGATLKMSYWSTHSNGRIKYDTNTALCNCAIYTETRIVNGVEVTLDDWRLPTEAEIRLIDRLQNDPKSAVKAIMTGKFYWGAQSNAAVELQGGDGGESNNAHVRCVRDVKDNTLKAKVPYRLNR